MTYSRCLVLFVCIFGLSECIGASDGKPPLPPTNLVVKAQPSDLAKSHLRITEEIGYPGGYRNVFVTNTHETRKIHVQVMCTKDPQQFPYEFNLQPKEKHLLGSYDIVGTRLDCKISDASYTNP